MINPKEIRYSLKGINTDAERYRKTEKYLFDAIKISPEKIVLEVGQGEKQKQESALNYFSGAYLHSFPEYIRRRFFDVVILRAVPWGLGTYFGTMGVLHTFPQLHSYMQDIPSWGLGVGMACLAVGYTLAKEYYSVYKKLKEKIKNKKIRIEENEKHVLICD